MNRVVHTGAAVSPLRTWIVAMSGDDRWVLTPVLVVVTWNLAQDQAKNQQKASAPCGPAAFGRDRRVRRVRSSLEASHPLPRRPERAPPLEHRAIESAPLGRPLKHDLHGEVTGPDRRRQLVP